MGHNKLRLLYFFNARAPFLFANFNARTCSNPGRAVVSEREPPATSEHPMFDLVLVVGGIGLFGLMIVYTVACNQL
jgi:hypothetical protein